jgi:hypothetical protein
MGPSYPIFRLPSYPQDAGTLPEALLAGRKAGTLTPEEAREYEAICDLDTALSWLNRLARGARTA